MIRAIRRFSFETGFVDFIGAFRKSRGVHSLTGFHIIAWSAVMLLAIAITFAINIWNARQQLLNDGDEDAVVLTNLADAQVNSAISMTSFTLAAIQDEFRLGEMTQHISAELDASKSARNRLLPFQTNIIVTDETGKVVMDTSGKTDVPMDLSMREYFQFHLSHNSMGDFFGRPFYSERSNKQIFSVTRRLENAQGRFAGVVFAGIDIDYFERVYGALRSHHGGGFLLARDDGIILARGPHIDGLVGKSMKQSPLFEEHLPRAPAGNYRKAGFADNVNRLFGYKKLDNFPLVVSVGLNQSEILAAWQRNNIVYAIVAAALMTIIAWLAVNFSNALVRDNELATQLKTSEEKLNGIVTSAMDAIITTDENQMIEQFNASAERMFGISSRDAIGRPLDILLPNAARARHHHLVRAFGESGVTTRMMGSLGLISARRESGVEFPAEASISQLNTERGKYYTVILRDITLRVRAQEALARSHAELEQRVLDRTAALENSRQRLQAFNYAVSHDLRAPVRHINGYAEIILQDAHTLSDRVKDCVNRIISATHRMEGIIEGLLRLARINNAQLKRKLVDLGALIKSVADECAPAGWNGQLRLNIESFCTVEGDEVLLRQLFYNLVSNAFKFTAKTPRPVIDVFGSISSDNEIIATVRDNGAGFDMQYAGKLFQPLQRLHRADDFEGTGIGLASAKQIAEMHDGRIWAEATPGQGASIFVALKCISESGSTAAS